MSTLKGLKRHAFWSLKFQVGFISSAGELFIDFSYFNAWHIFFSYGGEPDKPNLRLGKCKK
jgi:hypothetical protein